MGHGSLGLGESYMEGWWDRERIDEFVCRALCAGLDRQVRNPAPGCFALKARLITCSRPRLAGGRAHYDTGNRLFEAMSTPACPTAAATGTRPRR